MPNQGQVGGIGRGRTQVEENVLAVSLAPVLIPSRPSPLQRLVCSFRLCDFMRKKKNPERILNNYIDPKYFLSLEPEPGTGPRLTSAQCFY